MAVFWPRFVVDAAKTLWIPLNTVLFSSRGAYVSVRCLCLWPWYRRTLSRSGVNRSNIYLLERCFTSNHFLGSFIFIIWETAKRYCHCETWCLKWVGELTSKSYKKKQEKNVIHCNCTFWSLLTRTPGLHFRKQISHILQLSSNRRSRSHCRTSERSRLGMSDPMC